MHIALALALALLTPALPTAAIAQEVTPVTIQTLLSVSGPVAAADTTITVRRGSETITQGDGPVLSLDLAPGSYAVDAASGLARRTERLRVRPQSGEQLARVNLRSGILAVRSRSAVRMVLMEPEPDVFGEQAVLAETQGQTWALTVPQGRYRLLIEGAGDRVILDQDVEIVPARREIVTTR